VIGAAGAADVIAQAGPSDADGWLTLTIRLESLWYGESSMLRLGKDAEVIGPPELRERLAATSSEMAARYGRSS
jgi:predicted DNA-binding transcriptional regulator YafY